MRLVLQRVENACVRVEDAVVGSIARGILCYVGIGQEDGDEDLEWCARKLLVRHEMLLIIKLFMVHRIFDFGPMNRKNHG